MIATIARMAMAMKYITLNPVVGTVIHLLLLAGILLRMVLL